MQLSIRYKGNVSKSDLNYWKIKVEYRYQSKTGEAIAFIIN